MAADAFDVAVVGGGLVGAATASVLPFADNANDLPNRSEASVFDAFT